MIDYSEILGRGPYTSLRELVPLTRYAYNTIRQSVRVNRCIPALPSIEFTKIGRRWFARTDSIITSFERDKRNI